MKRARIGVHVASVHSILEFSAMRGILRFLMTDDRRRGLPGAVNHIFLPFPHDATTLYPASFSDSSTCLTARLSGLQSSPVDFGGSIDSAIAMASEGSTRGPAVGLRSVSAASSIRRRRVLCRMRG